MSISRDSSPLATVDDIHKRLLRPPSLQSRTEEAGSRRNPSQLKATPSMFRKKQDGKQREITKRKLEDYLDPVLIRAISSEIGGGTKNKHETKSKLTREVEDFEWPVDKLKVLVEDSRSTDKRKMEAVNLGDEMDLIDEDDVGDGEEECWTPFQRFEHTALRKFNG